MDRYSRLEDWLAWQEDLHVLKVDMSLERVQEVLSRMQLGRPAPVLVTIGGTNGKGSSIAMLECILRHAGLRVATYTSPHLLRYNERIRIQGRDASDADLCDAFSRVDRARGETTLTYFEFGTLAALDLFARADVDVALLEVGLGGRLDAVNVLDTDIALISSVDLDHQAWLGDDRESIGWEKAGIFRKDVPAICADPQPPQRMRDHAKEIGARWFAASESFGLRAEGDSWSWWGPDGTLNDLPKPRLIGHNQLANASGVLMAIHCLRAHFPVSETAIREGLAQADLAGRAQTIAGPVETILDVAHNPHAARALARTLDERPIAGRTHAVLGMFKDKDAAGVVQAMAGVVDHWHLGELAGSRTLPVGKLRGLVDFGTTASEVHSFESVAAAYRNALTLARQGDRVVVFGSFLAVAAALQEGV